MNGIAIQLICHAWGDYVLQNHWMANKKTTEWLPAIVHVILYTVPFLIMFGWHPAALGVIAGTHLVIDHYRLANYWVRFWGTGCEGWVARKIRIARTPKPEVPHYPGEGNPAMISAEIPPVADAPPWLGVWLMIIVDNIFHVTINALALAYLAS